MLESLQGNQFTYKKLTPEEQEKRGILGRLTGIIASTKEPTRNGRSYSKKLWENVFNNPIMQEKIKTRCVLGELGHPADRTEIDMEKVAICLAETPKCGEDGNLYGVFDILNTPNGRILKTLCDYGSIIGVSSRGQGDLVQDYNGNESVDPDTYDCECWDAVLVPALESARMKYINEGLNLREVKLKKALTESLNKASLDDKQIMEETLKNLNINLTEAKKDKEEKEEDKEEKETDVNDAVEEESSDSIEDDEVLTTEPTEENSEENIEEIDVIDDFENVDEKDLPEFDLEAENASEEEKEDLTIDSEEEFINYLKNNFTEDQVKKVSKILNINNDETIETEEEDEESEDVSTEDEESEEAIDNGNDEVIESLKEALKDKLDLENNVKILNEKLAVSDIKVDELNEECDRYKKSLVRLASLSKANKDEISKLNDSLKAKDVTIAEQLKEINSQKVRITRLSESNKAQLNNSQEINKDIDSKNVEIKNLNESLTKAKSDAEGKVKQLNEEFKIKFEANEKEISELKESLTKATSIKESYKKLANKAVNKYIEVKAMTLGLTSQDIKRKLGESYSMEDVDQVCEELKAYQFNISKLPFSVDRKVSVRVSESNSKKSISSIENIDDQVDDSLIKLANI